MLDGESHICYNMRIRTFGKNLTNLGKRPYIMAVFLVVLLFVAASPLFDHTYTVSRETNPGPLSQTAHFSQGIFLQGLVINRGIVAANAAEEEDNSLVDIEFEENNLFPASLRAETFIESPTPSVQEKKLSTSPAPQKPKFSLIRPAAGKNQGVIHSHNGVDISNSCGTPIYASAAGTVRLDPIGNTLGGWNGGYGNLVLINHGNGIETLYAHLSKVLVSIGQRVSQGDKIGIMGDTGESTGCHLHFEVHGARNPLGKR
jgi:murein DD-endopeptidase MepM/ murein hydrolase activator NlpD